MDPTIPHKASQTKYVQNTFQLVSHELQIMRLKRLKRLKPLSVLEEQWNNLYCQPFGVTTATDVVWPV